MGNIWPNNAADWLRSIADEAEKREMSNAYELHLPSINMLLANTLQRVAISINIHRLLDIEKGKLYAQTKPLHLLIQGTAGTGKTFIISAVTRVARRCELRFRTPSEASQFHGGKHLFSDILVFDSWKHL